MKDIPEPSLLFYLHRIAFATADRSHREPGLDTIGDPEEFFHRSRPHTLGDVKMRKTSIQQLGFATVLTALSMITTSAAAEEAKSQFARQTVDLGIVVSDIAKSAKFYTEAIGFTEQKGFSVPGDFSKNAGLTAGQNLEIRVFKLGNNKTATGLKLMQVPGAKSKSVDHSTIHASLGYSYITIHITDTNAAVARLAKHGVKPIAKGPIELPKGLPQGIFLTVVRDPDGNLVELVGPKK
jgi:catechol 2,3-dioxygenase-like lactoylglutathione lyase family enzyme